jgi:hypothetical protein
VHIDGSALAPPDGDQVTLGGWPWQSLLVVSGPLGKLLSIARRSRQGTQPESVPPAPR